MSFIINTFYSNSVVIERAMGVKAQLMTEIPSQRLFIGVSEIDVNSAIVKANATMIIQTSMLQASCWWSAAS